MNENDEELAEVPESSILIQFAAPGAVLMNAQWKNCFPAQLLVAGEYLTRRAKALMEQAEHEKRMQDEASRIAKPETKLIVPK